MGKTMRAFLGIYFRVLGVGAVTLGAHRRLGHRAIAR